MILIYSMSSASTREVEEIFDEVSSDEDTSDEEISDQEKAVIYIATNKNTNKSYIGQAVCYLSSGTKWGMKRRWLKHVSNANVNNHECQLLENSIAKHGSDAFNLKVVKYCHISKLNELEDKYIKQYNTLSPHGYNLMTGGGNGRKHHQETRKKMSKTRTGKKHSEMTKQKMSETANIRESISNETRIKMSQSAKNKPKTTMVTRINMSHANSDRVLELLEEFELEKFHKNVQYCISTSGEGFSVRKSSTIKKGFTSTSSSKTMKDKYEECLNYLKSINIEVENKDYINRESDEINMDNLNINESN
jgi:group I intron endonuclease